MPSLVPVPLISGNLKSQSTVLLTQGLPAVFTCPLGETLQVICEVIHINRQSWIISPPDVELVSKELPEFDTAPTHRHTTTWYDPPSGLSLMHQRIPPRALVVILGLNQHSSLLTLVVLMSSIAESKYRGCGRLQATSCEFPWLLHSRFVGSFEAAVPYPTIIAEFNLRTDPEEAPGVSGTYACEDRTCRFSFWSALLFL